MWGSGQLWLNFVEWRFAKSEFSLFSHFGGPWGPGVSSGEVSCQTDKPERDAEAMKRSTPLQQNLREINLQSPREMQKKPLKMAKEYLKEPVEGNIDKQEDSRSI